MSWSGTLDVARSTYLLTPERLEALRAAGSDGSWDRLSWMDEGKPSEVGAGTVLGGRFLVRDPLGSGSFGQVYQALDEREQRTVAVKVLAPLDEKDQRAARREIAALRVLDLPGVVPFLDSGVVGEQTWVAMELVEGAPFPGYLRGGWDDIAGPTLRLVEALARVHRAGFVHGDLKPMNVLVDREGQPWLLDFGLVRGAYTGCSVDHDGRVGGTPRYLAPEQFYGAHATVQSDLFALGVMLFELLAGRAPFRGVTFAELCASRMMGPPPLEVGPPPLRALVAALLAAAPGDRPPSCEVVVERLLEVMPTPAHVQWPTDQNELFAGPERLFGLPSRAVAVLTARTGDEPGRRLRELRRWERAGLARWNGSRFVVTHADLDRLVDEERSLRHGLDLLGGAPGADRLLDDAADLADRGRLGPAWARVEQALALLDADGDEPKRALELGACIALFGASPDWLRRLRAALRRAGLPADAPLVRLAASATEVLRRGGEDQLPALAALPPFRHDDLETWRQALRIYAARRVGVLAEQALLDELAPWAREHGGDREARWQGWWGWLHYRQGRYEQAAEHCLAEARGRRAAIGRLAAAVRAGGAWLETSHLDRCARIAREGLERALALHVPIYAAHASQLLRCVAYRSGRADRVDEELLEAAERLGVPSLQGLMLLNEAAVAWRAGLPKAQRLAERALAAFVTGRRRSEAGLARALALAAGSELRPEAVIECEQDLRAGGLPGIELQGLALLERVAPEVARRERLEELVVGFQGDGWYRRRELLAPAECGFGVC